MSTKKKGEIRHSAFPFNKMWHSRWFAGKSYAETLYRDLKLREHLKKRLRHAGVSEIDIERTANKVQINIYTSRPGIIIGRKGAELDTLRDELQKMANGEVYINIQEIERPELDAQLVAESIATQLERRIAFRRAMKKASQSAFRFAAKGIKVRVAGRLDGGGIARAEWYQDGRLPLHTLKADIDYGSATATTASGPIVVKVWIYKGEIAKKRSQWRKARLQRSAVESERRKSLQLEMQRMIESMIPPSSVPLPPQVLQARRNAEARAELLQRWGAFKSAEVGQAAGSKASNRAALAHRWKSDGRVFSVVHHGETYFPGFQFASDGQPLRVIAAIITILGRIRPGWELALWFTASNGWLDGRLPVDLLTISPDAVVEAARREAEERVF